MKDEYLTVSQSLTAKAIIRRSEFLAHVKEVADESEAKDFIVSIKEEHRQATHNCSAYRIGLPPDEVTFADDNGEPGGTAGKPILGAILSRKVTNIVVVVTRYFGGKKLGVRGLIDAYGGVSGDCIDLAGVITRIIEKEIKLRCAYDQIDRVMYLVNKYAARMDASDYAETVKMTLVIRRSLAGDLKKELEPFVTIMDNDR